MGEVDSSGKKKRGRPRLYGHEAMAAVRLAWEASDCLCSKRLQPFLPELASILKRCGELTVTKKTQAQFCQMSPSTIDRLLRRWRGSDTRRGLSTTKPGTLLKNSIPIRTFSDWNENEPGFLEADLVAHCGESAEGFYLTTLSTVDVATGWCEPVAIWGKGQEHVGGAVYYVRRQLPMPMLGLDSDNSSECINQSLQDYCRRNGITFTRSRYYKKNDICPVKQKNWTVIRRVIGHDRFSSKAVFKALRDIYILLCLYINFLQPVSKLLRKSRHGAKVYRLCNTAQTPYQRLLRSGVLTEDQKRELTDMYGAINPVTLLQKIRQSVGHLCTLAER